MIKKLPLALMIGALLSATEVLALGMGDIKVNSSLNQRLNAEIELLSSVEGELDDVNVKLGSVSAFDRIKLARPYLLTGIKFKVSTREDGTPIVKLTTKEVIREPFLDFLVEVDWPKGRLLREYTILLDPPVTMSAPAAKAAAPVTKDAAPAEVVLDSSAADEPVEPAPVVSSPAVHDTGRVDSLGFPIYSDSPADAPSDSGQVSYSGDSYGPVDAQETLWSIATKTRPSDTISNQQMMLALHEANPDAFIDGNIHQLKKGAILRIPDMAMLESRSVSSALSEVKELNASLPAQAGAQPSESAAPVPEQTGVPASSPAVSSQPTESADDGRLNIVAADQAASSAASTKAQKKLDSLKRELRMAEETLSSQRQENTELRGRVKELESAVAEMEELKRLLDIQNAEMAKMQQQLASAESQPEPEPVEITPVAEPEPLAVEPEPAPAPEPEPAEVVEEPATEVVVDTEVTTVSVDEEPAETQPEPVKPAPEPVQPPAKTDPVSQIIAFGKKLTSDPLGAIDMVKNSPILMGVVGVVALVLVALLALIFRRGKKDDDLPASTDTVTVEKASFLANLKDKFASKKKAKSDAAETADMDFEEAEPTNIHATEEAASEQASDATILEAPPVAGAADAVADMDFEAADSGQAEAADSAAEEPVGKDPLEEVDVYEAFGDFEQAAELVKQAIGDHPDNIDFKLRLFNVYNSGGMADEFATAATQYESELSGTSQWDEIVAMGKQIAPDCSAWGGGGSAAQAAPDMAATQMIDTAAAPTGDGGDIADMDLDFGDIGEETPSDVPVDSEMTMNFADLQPKGAAESEPDPIADITPAAPLDPLPDDTGESELEFDLGDMDFDSSDDAAEETAAEPAATDSGDSNELEFDLGDFDAGGDEAAADTDSPASDTSDAGLEFELDDSISQPSEQVSETVKVDASADLDLGTEDPTVLLGDDLMSSAAPAGDEPEESSLGVDLSDFSVDMDDSTSAGDDVAAADISLDISGDNAAAEAADLELGDDSADSGLDASLELDALEMDEDLGFGEPDAQPEAADPGDDPTVMLAEDSDLSIDSLALDGDEVSTKLDLARAYVDMGDAEGAKGILEEVMQEGNDSQKSEAQELLKQLG